MLDVESRLAALEKQVAELMLDKAERDKEALNSFLQSSATENATDAFVVLRENKFVDKGIYCLKCLENSGKMTFIPIPPASIPGALSSPMKVPCPHCEQWLQIQWANR